MLAYRVIARLDIKGPNLIKGIQFEGLRVLGKPADFAKKYADEGADELLYLDTVASLYGRNQLESLIEETSDKVFIPITIAGGIQKEVGHFFRLGADRLAINSAAVRWPDIVSSISQNYGCQALPYPSKPSASTAAGKPTSTGAARKRAKTRSAGLRKR